MASLYADENFPVPAVLSLRGLGHDVLTAQEAGQSGKAIPDEAVLAFAHAEGRALLTHNRKDFRKLHNRGLSHSGLVVCTTDSDFEGLAHRIDGALATAGDPAGQLIRVTRESK